MFWAEFRMEGIDKMLRKLDQEVVRRAGRRAIKRTAGAAKTIISRQIRQKFNLKKAEVDSKIWIGLEGLDELKARVSIMGDPTSLTRFNPQQIRGRVQTFVSKDKGLAQKRRRSGGKYAGVKVVIVKGKTTQLRNAFIALGKGGTPLVFQRKGKGRKPIMAQKLITVQSIVEQPSNLKAIEARVKQQLQKEMSAQLKHAIGENK